MNVSSILRPQTRRIAYFTLFLSPAFAATLLLIILPGITAPQTVWRGYHLLLIDGEAELDPVLDSLEIGGIDHVSIRNTEVKLNVFSGLETISLASVKARLDTDDPRLDRYMQSASGIFSAEYRGKAWNAVFIKSKHTQLGLLRALRRHIGSLGIGYVIPEWQIGWLLCSPLAVYSFLFFLVRNRRRVWRSAVTLIPLVVLAARSSGLGMAAAVLLVPGSICLVEIIADTLDGYLYDRKVSIESYALLRAGLLLCIGIACAYLLSVFHINPAGFRGLVTLTIISLILLTAGMYGLRVLRSEKTGHKVFIGVEVLRDTGFVRRQRSSKAFAPIWVLLLTVCVFVPALVFLSRQDPGLSVAAPAAVGSAKVISWESLTAVVDHKRENRLPNRLPDLSDYLTHRAYQDSLLYKRDWIYPSPNSGIAISGYAEEEGEVGVSAKRMITFDAAWFDRVLSDAANDTLGGMLINQGGSTAVGYRSGSNYPFPQMVRSGVVLVLAVAALLFLLPSLTSNYFYGMRNLPLRRKRQTA